MDRRGAAVFSNGAGDAVPPSPGYAGHVCKIAVDAAYPAARAAKNVSAAPDLGGGDAASARGSTRRGRGRAGRRAAALAMFEDEVRSAPPPRRCADSSAPHLPPPHALQPSQTLLRRQDPDLFSAEEARAALLKGASFLKHGRAGRPKARFLRLADAGSPGAELRWRSAGGGARGARLAAVDDVSTSGAGTPGFARHPPPPGALALALVFEDGTSLELSCADAEQHALWRAGLRAAARAARRAAEAAAAGDGGGRTEAGALSLARLSAGSAASSFASRASSFSTLGRAGSATGSLASRASTLFRRERGAAEAPAAAAPPRREVVGVPDGVAGWPLGPEAGAVPALLWRAPTLNPLGSTAAPRRSTGGSGGCANGRGGEAEAGGGGGGEAETLRAALAERDARIAALERRLERAAARAARRGGGEDAAAVAVRAAAEFRAVFNPAGGDEAPPLAAPPAGDAAAAALAAERARLEAWEAKLAAREASLAAREAAAAAAALTAASSAGPASFALADLRPSPPHPWRQRRRGAPL